MVARELHGVRGGGVGGPRLDRGGYNAVGALTRIAMRDQVKARTKLLTARYTKCHFRGLFRAAKEAAAAYKKQSQ